MESRNPSVVTKAVFAPLRSINALVARVVPWKTSVTAEAGTLACASTAVAPSSTARSGASGVVKSFNWSWPPTCSSTTSVKVPPISTANRASLLIRTQPTYFFDRHFRARSQELVICWLGSRASTQPHYLGLCDCVRLTWLPRRLETIGAWQHFPVLQRAVGSFVQVDIGQAHRPRLI